MVARAATLAEVRQAMGLPGVAKAKGGMATDGVDGVYDTDGSAMAAEGDGAVSAEGTARGGGSAARGSTAGGGGGGGGGGGASRGEQGGPGVSSKYSGDPNEWGFSGGVDRGGDAVQGAGSGPEGPLSGEGAVGMGCSSGNGWVPPTWMDVLAHLLYPPHVPSEKARQEEEARAAAVAAAAAAAAAEAEAAAAAAAAAAKKKGGKPTTPSIPKRGDKKGEAPPPEEPPKPPVPARDPNEPLRAEEVLLPAVTVGGVVGVVVVVSHAAVSSGRGCTLLGILYGL
eukprot:jgi/Mesvir1/21884/Mv01953-RA.1